MTARQLARALRRAHARSASKQARYETAARAALRDLLRTAASRFERSATVFLTAAAGEGPGWTPPADDELLSLDEIVGRYRGQTDPIRQSAVADFFAAFGSVAEASGVKANWSTSNPMIAAYLERTGSQISNVAETTRTNVRGIIARSYQDGLSVPDTASAIRAYADSISASRAALIARTEFVGLTRGASLEATQIVSQETGDTYLKRWMTAPGAEYPRHEDYDGLDGQTVPLDGLFEVGDDQLKYPGDPDGDPGEVCNCRCDLEYVEPSEATVEGETLTMPTVGQIDLTNAPQLGGGMNVNEVFGPIRIGDGEFVVKPEPNPENVFTLRRTITAGQDIEREDAAYRVSRWIDRLAPDLGVNTPRFAAGTVRRPETYFDEVVGRTFPAESDVTETVRAGISEFVPDAVPALDHEGGPLAVYEEDLRKGAFYDALIGNLDRHEMNYLIDGDDRMWLIDHGLSFPEENFGAPENGVLYNNAVERFADESGLLDLSDEERAFLSAIQGRRAEVESDLAAAGLPQSARDAFWARVSHMLRYHVVSYGPG